jgi:hypothetical protein
MFVHDGLHNCWPSLKATQTLLYYSKEIPTSSQTFGTPDQALLLTPAENSGMLGVQVENEG